MFFLFELLFDSSWSVLILSQRDTVVVSLNQYCHHSLSISCHTAWIASIVQSCTFLLAMKNTLICISSNSSSLPRNRFSVQPLTTEPHESNTNITLSPRRNILLMNLSWLTTLPPFWVSVHISFTFSSTMLQCLSKALILASNLWLFLTLIRTCVCVLVAVIKIDNGPVDSSWVSSTEISYSLDQSVSITSVAILHPIWTVNLFRIIHSLLNRHIKVWLVRRSQCVIIVANWCRIIEVMSSTFAHCFRNASWLCCDVIDTLATLSVQICKSHVDPAERKLLEWPLICWSGIVEKHDHTK